jgi:deoxyribonuclease V
MHVRVGGTLRHLETWPGHLGPPLEWPTDLAQARAVQEALRHSVVEKTPSGFDPRHVAGVDVHFSRDGATAYAAAVLLDAATRELEESALVAMPAAFPYRTGFLSFREVPAAMAALALLGRPPALVMVDGQGRAHPRRIGFASHLGLLTGLPTIGVAKSRLLGRFAEPAPEAGAQTPLEDRGEIVGAVVRTRAGCRPLFVSVGHLVDIGTAVTWVMRLTTGRHRLPEPTRLADRLSRAHG